MYRECYFPRNAEQKINLPVNACCNLLLKHFLNEIYNIADAKGISEMVGYE